MKKNKRPNHCTFYPEGDWSTCCQEHDLNYAFGVNKFESDLAFIWCLFKKACKYLIQSMFIFISIPIVLLFITTFGWYFYLKAKKKREEKE